jgi:hypothetical protein
LRPRSDDFSTSTENRRIFYYANVLEGSAAPWSSFTAQRKKLANIGQKQVGSGSILGQARILQLWHCERNACSAICCRANAVPWKA